MEASSVDTVTELHEYDCIGHLLVDNSFGAVLEETSEHVAYIVRTAPRYKAHTDIPPLSCCPVAATYLLMSVHESWSKLV